jgi:hypothetical protein
MNIISKNTIAIGGFNLPTVIEKPIYASVRFRKDGSEIIDGRIYKTEAAMRRNVKSRPQNASCIKINKRVYGQSGFRGIEFEII